MTVLADIHTHPDEWTGQSWSDQTNPMVSKVGHIALIAPFYARMSNVTLAGVGVYEYEGNHNWTVWQTGSEKIRII